MGQVKPIQRRIFEAIQATPSDKRGYVLNEAMRFAGDRVSFSDLLTDLGPFIESEIERAVSEERERCIGDVEAEITEDTHPQGHHWDVGTVNRISGRIRVRAT